MLSSKQGLKTKGSHISLFVHYVYKFLLSMLLKAQNDGLIQVIKTSRHGPIISHLLYAENLIIFFKATTMTCDRISQILDFANISR